MSLQSKQFYEFASFRLDPSEKVLLHEGRPVPLTPKVFDTLQVLVENAGHLLAKRFLMQHIWPDRFVEESNLTFNIKMLRKALGDDAASPRFIETVPRRGYRFIAEVRKIEAEEKRAIARDENKLTATPAMPEPTPARRKSWQVLVIFGGLLIPIFFAGRYLQPGWADQVPPILISPFAAEKLSTNGNVGQAVISPDGKYVVYVNGFGGEKQSVWLRQLESANNVEIIPPTEDFYAGLALSPDGNFLYFSRRPRNFDGQADIYRVSVFGGVAQKIIGETQGWISLSPDGQKISFVRCYYRNKEFCSLWIADSQTGGGQQKIASRPRPYRIGDNEFSPDGKAVAFAVGQSENQSNEFSLMQVDIESGVEKRLTDENFFNIKSLTWLPGKKGLLLTASKIPNRNFLIWHISENGESLPLTKDSETYSVLSFDKTAQKLVSTRVVPDFVLYVGRFENASGRRAVADAAHVSFAPDGKILYSSAMSGNDEIWSVNDDGSGQRQLTNDRGYDTRPIVSPDGATVFFSSNRTGTVHLWQMTPDGSSQTRVTRKEGGFPISVSGDGEWVYYHHGLDRTLWRVSLKNGREQKIYGQGKYEFALSPDGKLFSFSDRSGPSQLLKIASVADGKPVRAYQIKNEGGRILEIFWKPDGKGIYYTTADSEFEKNVLWLQRFDERSPQRIADLGDEETFSLSVSPDGKQFAYIQGRWKHDAVLITGLK